MIDSEATDMSRYVAKLSLGGIEGLGVVVPWHILTCAHFAEAVKIGRLNWLEIKGTIPGCSEEVYYAQTLDCLMDFMVLGDEPLNIGLDDGGWVEPLEPPIKPVRIMLPEGQAAVRTPVYFFAADGKTPVFATAKVYQNSHTIELDRPLPKGASGGPLFTADNRLIGIMQGTLYFHGSMPDIGHAVRIDQAASGWLVDRLGGLDDWTVQGEFFKAEDGH